MHDMCWGRSRALRGHAQHLLLPLMPITPPPSLPLPRPVGRSKVKLVARILKIFIIIEKICLKYLKKNVINFASQVKGHDL